MTYDQAIEYLYGLGLFGAKPGLERALRLADLAGNPQKRLRFIHVAGTNGKGSTCAMLESVYRSSGLKVGLFTSPHLVSFSERIQINRFPVSPSDVVDLVRRVQAWIAQGWTSPASPGTYEDHPTFFEVVTILALIYFAEQRCDLVIWETGLGGRLDATNIVTPLASVVTNVQWDHQQWLGGTLREIAFEKAGIFKPGVPAFMAATEHEAVEEIRRVALELHIPLEEVTQNDLARLGLDVVPIPLFGAHQRLNAALAACVIRGLNFQLPVPHTALCEGLSQVAWRGRFEVFKRPSGGIVVVDGAHNPAGASALREALTIRYPNVTCCMIFGVLSDKDWPSIIRSLASLPHRVLLVPVRSERSANPTDLKAAWAELNPCCQIQSPTHLREALEMSSTEPLTVVLGSLFLVGEALRLLNAPAPAEAAFDESALNEWGGIRN